MSATINLEKEKHFPVLLDELVNIISPHYGGTFVDCTFGQGCYSKKILDHQDNKIIALDRDTDTLKNVNWFKEKYKERFYFENKKFSDIDKIEINIENLKAVIFDLGYSFNQIKDPKKGLSFNSIGKLNMKMGLNDVSADEVVNNLDQKSLEKIFKFFGEENKYKLISKRIVELRKNKNINTEDLVKIINSAKKNKNYKIHNATKVFQALRIFVNQEISELIYGLINSFKILPIGGVIIVVTFHSIEDRIVKFLFKNYSENKNTSRYIPNKLENKKLFKLIEKKPILPSLKEKKINPPSRSAKLRYAIKIADKGDFTEFLKKFNYLIDIENLANQL